MRKKLTHFQQKLRFFLYRTTLNIYNQGYSSGDLFSKDPDVKIILFSVRSVFFLFYLTNELGMKS